jgi:hypothetical protein
VEVVIVAVRVSPLFFFLTFCFFPSFHLFLVTLSSPSIPAFLLRSLEQLQLAALWGMAYQSLSLCARGGGTRAEASSMRQRFSVRVGTGTKAPLDPPFAQIPAAFHVELVLLEDEDEMHNRSCSFRYSWFYARRRSRSRYASLSTCSVCPFSWFY